MSKGELLMLCRKIPHIPEGFASHVTRVFDRNRNGVVDLQEFLITIHEFVKGTPEQRLGLYFRLCDLNGNGTIDKKEMVKMFGVGLQLWTKGIFHSVKLFRCASKP